MHCFALVWLALTQKLALVGLYGSECSVGMSYAVVSYIPYRSGAGGSYAQQAL